MDLLKAVPPFAMKRTRKTKKPGGVTADDCIRVVLAHGGAAGNAEKDGDDQGGG